MGFHGEGLVEDEVFQGLPASGSRLSAGTGRKSSQALPVPPTPPRAELLPPS